MSTAGAALCAALCWLAFAGPADADSQGGQSSQPVSGLPVNQSTINRSATITTGNSFQQLLPSNYLTQTPRASLTIENNNPNGDNCWLFIGSGTATKATAILLLPGGSYSRYWPYVPSDAIQATCASNSDTLYVDTQ